MKFVKIFIAFVLIAATIGIGKAFTTDLNEVKVDDNSKKVEISDDKYDSQKGSNYDREDKIVVEDEKKEIKQETAQPSKQPETKKETTKHQETNNSNSSTIKPAEVIQNPVPTPEKPKEIPIWEKLGMTENHYYNEPMYSWEHVDFSSAKYGDEKNTKKACLEYGDKYEPYLNGEVSFNCSTVTSTSGKYLGEMFYTEKLN